MIASHTAPDQPPALDSLVQELAAYVRQAAAAGGPAHDVEHGIWTRRAYLPGTNAVEVLDLLHVTPRLRYAAYLTKGYPIASGVIEGACRHSVKDRLERAGMHWTRAGAQAMLDVRSEFLNGDWEAFPQLRIDRVTWALVAWRATGHARFD